MTDNEHNQHQGQHDEENNEEQNQEQAQGKEQDITVSGTGTGDASQTEAANPEPAAASAESSAEPASAAPSSGSPAEAEDLFDLLGDDGKQYKKKTTAASGSSASSTSSASASKQAQPKEEASYPEGSTVVYSGHKIELPETMTGTKVLEFLADDFPELTKDTTEFTFDEERGRIVPTRKALKKGSLAGALASYSEESATGFGNLTEGRRHAAQSPGTIQVETRVPSGPIPPVRRVLDRDGVYEIRNSDLGCFIARVPSKIDLGLRESVTLRVPKAPVSLLEKTVKIFKERPRKEALVTIVYDHRDGRHHLIWVDQETTATSVKYDAVPESEHLTTFMEIHSHNTMEAFFSSTDDGSEAKSTGLYGVIGRVDLDRPTARFRFSCGTHFRPLGAESLFDDPERVRSLIQEHPV